MTHSPPQWIAHIDMDAFFASVEQLDNPALRGKPLIIGGGERGVVCTCSYEARKFGVRSAMPIATARKLCPQAVYQAPRMQRYAEKSAEVMHLLSRYSPLVEQASVDEAYLDFTGLEGVCATVVAHAQHLQHEVFARTGLTCSVGLAPVKFLAKIASDMKKPAGLTVLEPDMLPGFLAALPVRKIPGVGKQTSVLLDALSVYTAGDVLRYPKEFWQRKLGKAGEALHDRAGGIDTRKVEPYTEPKSESAENTFTRDTSNKEELSRYLLEHAERVGARLRKGGRKGRTITLKIKYDDFTQMTRSRTLRHATCSTKEIYETGLSLLQQQPLARPLRLIGLGVSQFGDVPRQLGLFEVVEAQSGAHDAAIDETLDALREKFGPSAVIRGKLFEKKKGEPTS